MKPHRTHQIDDRWIYVIDHVFSKAQVEELQQYFLMAPCFRTAKDSNRTKHIRQMSIPVKHKSDMPGIVPTAVDLNCDRIFPVVDHWVGALFKKSNQERYKAHCNRILYGDMLFRHRDCQKHENHVTALIYANPTWKRSWGGETLFYNRAGDAQIAVSPKPGRLLLFEGAIQHRVSAPQRVFFGSRLTFAIKYQPVERTRRDTD